MINNGPPARRLEGQQQRLGRASRRVVELARPRSAGGRARPSRASRSTGRRSTMAIRPERVIGTQLRKFFRCTSAEVRALRHRLDRLDAEVAAHGDSGSDLLHQRRSAA